MPKEETMDEFLEQSVRSLAESIKTGQATSKQVTEAFLARIESVNGSINAVINLDADYAIKQAERADLALASGETPGKLFGVPMTIKDSLNTFDMVSTWGTTGRKDFRPGRDATCVERLRNEGAILMGKTNTPEFTLSFKTDNELFGKTSNPYDQERTSGGSSGGAAAIVSTKGSPFDIGTDTGGSVRLPSHFCGVAGIKPTTGRVPCTGNSLPSSGLLAPLSQPGPIAKTVDDLSYLLEIMQGPDNFDPHAIACQWIDSNTVSVDKLKVGFHLDNGIKTPDQDIKDSIAAAVARLRDASISVQEVRPSGLEMTGFIYSQLFVADNGDTVEALLEDCRTKTPAPYTIDILSNNSHNMSASEFGQVLNLWHNYQSSMLSFFNDFDILVCPVNSTTALKHNDPVDFASYTYTNAYNLTGWPAVVIRCGTDANGLPIGIQIVARPFHEHHCLALAQWLEAEFDEFPAANL